MISEGIDILNSFEKKILRQDPKIMRLKEKKKRKYSILPVTHFKLRLVS